jgi:hypothetical protein
MANKIKTVNAAVADHAGMEYLHARYGFVGLPIGADLCETQFRQLLELLHLCHGPAASLGTSTGKLALQQAHCSTHFLNPSSLIAPVLCPP